MTDLRPNSEISDGIHWIKDGYVNIYLIEHQDELYLIDTGMNKKASKVIKYVKSELESKKIASIMLTHHHTDHTGGLHLLNQEFHPRIHISPEDSVFVKGEKKHYFFKSPVLKPLSVILYNFMKTKPVQTLELCNEGDTINGFTVYSFPGHTLGSLGYLKNKVLFAGDAGVTSKGKVKTPPKLMSDNMKMVESSLKKMSKLNFEIILSGHGQPILSDASQRVKEAVEQLSIS